MCVGGGRRGSSGKTLLLFLTNSTPLRSCEPRSLISGVKRHPEVMGVRHYESHVSDFHLVGSSVFLDFMQMGTLKDFKHI